MNPRRTVIGAAALSLAVAGSLVGAQSAKADPVDCVICDTSPRVTAITGVMDKLNQLDSKFDAPLWKYNSPLQKLVSVLDKLTPGP